MLWKSHKPREDVCEKSTQVLLGKKKSTQQETPPSKLEFSKMPKDVEHLNSWLSTWRRSQSV